jgi:hypothetical protein
MRDLTRATTSQSQMTDQDHTAVSRTPTEIWWMILDEVVDCPKHFALVYNGENWAQDANIYTYHEDENEYSDNRAQRHIIAAVCRTWRYFAIQQKGRSTVVQGNQRVNQAKLKKAIRVCIIGKLEESTLLGIGKSVDWYILRTEQANAEQIGRLTLPHLRRLILTSRKPMEFDPSLCLKSLGSLLNLTWLQFSANFPTGDPFPASESKNIILLPNLQVLIYRTYKSFSFPSGTLKLPSLQHLSVTSDKKVTSFPPINDLLLPYCKTLNSVSINFNYRMLKKAHFLPWNELPNLLELVLDGPSQLRFHPLPHDHPLKRFYVRYWDAKEISSWMDSNNLRQIRLLDASWDHGVVKSQYGTWSISSFDMNRLLEQAGSRGIRLEVGLTASLPPTIRDNEIV